MMRTLTLSLLLLLASEAAGFSSSSNISFRKPAFTLNMSTKGCAAKPYEKKKIAVFGAGGYLGATIYGKSEIEQTTYLIKDVQYLIYSQNQ